MSKNLSIPALSIFCLLLVPVGCDTSDAEDDSENDTDDETDTSGENGTASDPSDTSGDTGTSTGQSASSQFVQFDVENYISAELDCIATISVVRTGGTDGVVTVQYATEDKTGIEDRNYASVQGTLRWEDGDAEAKTFDVPLLFDVDEEDKSVTLRLSSPGGAALGAPDTATLTIDSVSCEPPDQDLSTDVSLPKACYLIDQVTQQNQRVYGHLTVSPGTAFVFTEGRRMTIGEQGSITAVGTSECPIWFTADERQTGRWEGLHFWGDTGIPNRLEHVIVEYAGGGSYQKADVVIHAGDVAISGSTLRHSLEYGLQLEEAGLLTAFDNNSLTGNRRPARVLADVAWQLDKSSSYTGNTEDFVSVNAVGSHNDIPQDASHTWDALDASYLIEQSFRVNGNLEIEAGATIAFAKDTALRIGGGAYGSLTAVGTETSPIVFTGSEKTPGHWSGIVISSVEDNPSAFDHVTVEYAVKNIDLTKGRVSISNSTLRHASEYGIQLADFGSGAATLVDDFSGNTLTQNWRPVFGWTDTVYLLDSSSTFSGNTEDIVTTDASGSHHDIPVGSHHVWKAIDATYLIEAPFRVNGHLTIEAGANLIFAEGSAFYVGGGDNGQLTAVGTASAPITMTGSESVPGHWKGVRLATPEGVANTISHVSISHAGSDTYEKAAIDVTGKSQATITSSEFVSSAGYGIWIGPYASVSESDNTFTSCALGSVFQAEP